MSYDLFFKSRSGANESDVLSFFRDREFYTVEDNHVYYGNDDTGVYFGLEIGNRDHAGFPIALNINYCRPSYFGLEAAPQIAAFVAELDLALFDPQGAMTGDRFDPTLMIQAWNKGNVAATREIHAAAENEETFELPTEVLTRAWKWNFNRAQVQKSVGDSVFVPLIMFASIEGTTVTSTVWPDAIPALLPRVDHLCISRKVLAPRKWFSKEPDVTFISWREAEPTLLKYGSADPQGTISLRYDTPPKELATFVRKRPEELRTTLRLFPDRVLDREIVQNAKR
jgi:hypothetical protein